MKGGDKGAGQVCKGGGKSPGQVHKGGWWYAGSKGPGQMCKGGWELRSRSVRCVKVRRKDCADNNIIEACHSCSQNYSLNLQSNAFL